MDNFFRLGNLKAGRAFFQKFLISSISGNDKNKPHRNIARANSNSRDFCSTDVIVSTLKQLLIFLFSSSLDMTLVISS